MKFEVTYFDSLKNKEQTIRLTGINEAKVKENFISSYDQKRYPFKSIRAIWMFIDMLGMTLVILLIYLAIIKYDWR